MGTTLFYQFDAVTTFKQRHVPAGETDFCGNVKKRHRKYTFYLPRNLNFKFNFTYIKVSYFSANFSKSL